MNRLYLYHVATLIGGAALGIPAVVSANAGERSIPIVLRAVGGCGMAIAAIYEVFTGDPAEFTVGKYTVWPFVLGALSIVLGGAIRRVTSTPPDSSRKQSSPTDHVNFYYLSI